MTFTSSFFLVGVLPWFILVYRFWGFKKVNNRIILVLLFNTAFYVWGGVGAFIFLCLYSIIIYVLEIIESLFHKRWVLGLAIIIAVSPLLYAKYTKSIIECLNSVLSKNIPLPATFFPLGLSFFSFEAISLLVDTYHEKNSKVNLLYTYMYVSCFLTIISGPIIRFDEFENGLCIPEGCKTNFYDAIERIIIGLSKKVLIADKLAPLANFYFDGVAMNKTFSVLGFWVGSVAYTLQLYYDFSGYSDMVIGIGALMGINIKENFDKPYQASTISEFWGKWHISLTQWFRDYIYIPLGGNRCKWSRHLLNMLIVWIVTGLWHGTDWSYIIWGLGYYVLLVIEKYTLLASKIKCTVLGHIYTLFWVNLLWVFFRADNIIIAGDYIRGMFGEGTGLIENKALNFLPFILVAIGLCLPWNKWLSRYGGKKHFKIVKYIFIVFLAGMALCAVINTSYAPYIYGNF